MENTKEITLQDLAKEMSQAFEGSTRVSGESFRKLKEGSPKWMTAIIHAAHGDMLPDDWRYAFVEEVCDTLADAEDADEVQLEPDIYTNDLTAWLHSRADRVGYITEALEEGLGFKDGFQLLAYAQLREKEEVLAAMREALVDRVIELGE